MSSGPDETARSGLSESDVSADAVSQAAEELAAAAAKSNTTAGSEPVSDAQKLKAERDQYYEQWLRANAELDNYRKRMQREMEQAARFQHLSVIRDLLPVLDNLGRTIQAAEASGNVENLLQGVRMTVKQLEDVLGRHSAKPIDTVGVQFDPHLHDALMQVPSAEHPPMTIVQEVERGYTMHDRVVRPAKVIVSSAPAEKSDGKDS